MSALDDLLARTRQPGTFVEVRAFSLARDKALEKMREYTLRHPRQYALELVQAAVFAGARFIAIDVTDDEVVVAWLGGRPIGPAELESLLDYLFADQGQPHTRHLMQLAVGVNALLQRRPRAIWIESGDGTRVGSARLELRASGDGSVGVPAQALSGTYLRAAFRRDWLPRFGYSTARETTDLVEIRCAYSPVPILLNGQAPFGYASDTPIPVFGLEGTTDLTPPLRGALGLGEVSMVRFVVGGVWVVERPLHVLDPRLSGVVGDDRLRKTADMSDIVEDERFVDLLHDLLPAAQAAAKAAGVRLQARGLPPRASALKTDRAAVPAPAPLPDMLPQMAPRGPVRTADLTDGADDRAPLFCVLPQHTDTLASVCDPEAFPYRVLVLPQDVAAALSARLPHLARLGHAQDVAFVRHALQRGDVVHAVSFDSARIGRAARDGHAPPVRVTLRMHLDGREPVWDGPGSGSGAPLLIRAGDRALWCGATPLPLRHVSVVVDVGVRGAPIDPAAPGLHAAIAAEARRQAWRLVPEDPDALADGRGERLALTLLELFGRPGFYREADALRLGVHLPAAWEPRRDTLLGRTLAITDAGPLRFVDLVALQGTTRAVRAVEIPHPAALAAIEGLLGRGHVVTPETPAGLAVAVGRRFDTWSPIPPGAPPSGFDELIGVPPSWAAPEAPEGWVAAPAPAPALVHLVRVDAAPRDRAGGLVALLTALEVAARGDGPAAAVAHVDDVGVVARLHLGRLTGRLGEVRLTDVTGRAIAVPAALRDPSLRIKARGGPGARRPGVLAMTLDALLALEQAASSLGHSAPLPLLIDDEPSVWTETAPTAWLVREPLDVPGVTGWLGLRAPFDPTPAVLIDGDRGLEVLPQLTAALGCAGLVRLDEGVEPDAAQTDQIHLAASRLYERLLARLEEPIGEVLRETALACAARVALTRTRGGRMAAPPGLVAALAERVGVRGPDGAPWGTLARWLTTDPAARPALPEIWTVALGEPDPAGLPPVHDDPRLSLIEPVRRALCAQLRRDVGLVLVQAGERAQRAEVVWWTMAPPRVGLALPATPRWIEAGRGRDPHRGLARLELAHVLATWAKGADLPVDGAALAIAALADDPR